MKYNQDQYLHAVHSHLSSIHVGDVDTAVLAKCNPCLSSPCRNQGICHSDLVEIYRCSCPPGFKVRATQCYHMWHLWISSLMLKLRCWQSQCKCVSLSQGKNCETALNACVSNPCANGGTCQVNEHEEGQYRCGSQKSILKNGFNPKIKVTWVTICDDIMSMCVFF